MDKAVTCGGNDASDLGLIPAASKSFSTNLLGIRLKVETNQDKICVVWYFQISQEKNQSALPLNSVTWK